jgi:hypothetical protein
MSSKNLLPLLGVIVGWGLKAMSDYLLRRTDDMRRYRTATFYLLRAHKSLMDYERGTRYFRQERPTIDEFEPWRAILAARFLESVEAQSKTTSNAVEMLASVDPALATRMDNTIKNILFTFRRDLADLQTKDPEMYTQLLSNQDKLVEMTLSDFETVALRLASHGGFLQKGKVARWFSEREKGTVDFMKSMHAQKDVLRKIVSPDVPDSE